MEKKLIIFYLPTCPYCISARKAVEKLAADNPAYAEVPIEWKDETKIKDFPDWCDYYYVPTIFMGEQKLYEAYPGDSDEKILGKVREALEEAVRE